MHSHSNNNASVFLNANGLGTNCCYHEVLPDVKFYNTSMKTKDLSMLAVKAVWVFGQTSHALRQSSTNSVDVT